MKALALVALLAVAVEEPAVRVDVNPAALMEGGSVRLRCIVPKHEDNRKVEFGIEGFSSSERDLAGKDAAVYQPAPAGQVVYNRVPCDVGPAYCRLTRAGQRDQLAVMPLQIGGCSTSPFDQ